MELEADLNEICSAVIGGKCLRAHASNNSDPVAISRNTFRAIV